MKGGAKRRRNDPSRFERHQEPIEMVSFLFSTLGHLAFTKNDKSAYYLSLGVSYPNAAHAERGLRDGLITKGQYDAIMRALKAKKGPPQNTALGGDIYIHGNGAGSDWTWGCAALVNEDIRDLFDAVRVGTPVKIEQ